MEVSIDLHGLGYQQSYSFVEFGDGLFGCLIFFLPDQFPVIIIN